MNSIVKKVDGKLMAEIPFDLAEQMGIAEGDSVNVQKSRGELNEEAEQWRAAEAVIERHGEALRMLADR